MGLLFKHFLPNLVCRLITASHVHWKSGNILEMELDIDVVTPGHYLRAAIVKTLNIFDGHSLLQTFSSVICNFVAHRTVPLH